VLARELEGSGTEKPRARVGAVGPATADAIAAALGWTVDLVPQSFAGSDLAAAMTSRLPLQGARVLWPRAREAATDIGRQLIAAGASVDAPEAYATRPRQKGAETLAAQIRAGEIDVVTFTSPSAVRALQYVFNGTPEVVAAIGPATAAAVESAGWTVRIKAAEPTFDALTDAIVQWAGARS
jgi:uroporphyrinogen III methyltransferase / synthase